MPHSRPFTPAQIIEQVDKISQSSVLKNSPVLRQFLHFVVDEKLEGRGESIKEYTIGTQVLGRKSDFDPQLDAIVRIHAGRLRRALNEFYTGSGKGDLLKISIPKGGYSPDFTHHGLAESILEITTPVYDKLKKPVLAVMPFRNISSDSSHNFFCEEVGEFLSTELARFQELSLIAYSSCENVAAKSKDIGEMSALLGAEYILTGSVFVAHENLRMLMQLSRSDSGKQIWSQTFVRKGPGIDLFQIQDEIVNLVTASLGGYYGSIYRDVVEVSRANANPNHEMYSAIVWYDQFIKQLDKETFDKACESLEGTVKKDPEYALGWAVLSEIYAIGTIMEFRRVDNQTEKAISFARRAIKIDPESQHAYQALARAYFIVRNKEGVVEASEQCLALNPRASNFSARIGVFLIYAGEFERGAKILKASLLSNPHFPWMSSLALSLYHYYRNEFLEAREWAEKIDMPQLPLVHLLRAASLAQLGKLGESKKEVELLLAIKPDIGILGKPYISISLFSEDLVDKIIAGLEKAGLIIHNKESIDVPVNR